MFVRIGAALFVLTSSCSWAQADQKPQPATIADTERRILTSAVNNVKYQIDVALPRGYTASTRRYPVLYTLDGNAYFPLITDTYRLLRNSQILMLEDLIIVGIGYTEDGYAFWSPDFAVSRTRDYTPVPAKPVEGRGGAISFLRFLREELIPFVDATYRTVPNDRGLVGHSIAGLFTAYVLTHDPAAFQRYVIGSPSLWWDNEAAFRWESDYAAKHKELPARVLMYNGALEDEGVMIAPAKRFWEVLRSRQYSGAELLDYAIFPQESHTSVNVAAMTRVLRMLYTPRSISLPVEVLKRYTGTWKSGDQPFFTLRVEGDRLFAARPPYTSTTPEGTKLTIAFPPLELFAESETSFFTQVDVIRLVFTMDGTGKQTTELKVTRDGMTWLLKRASAEGGNDDVKKP
jgi:predicted alpha/beta superfamily hydrolase